MITMKAMPFDSEVTINPETGQEEYDRVAHSRDLADWLAAYFSNGILVRGSDLLTNELQVLHLSAMTCVVKPGIIVINGRTGFLEAQETIEFDVGESNPRIDRVVAELNIAERNVYIKILKGIAAAAPAPPNIIQTEDVYQIPLAQVRVNANQSVIATVTDERAGHISNVLLNQAPSEDIVASTVGISEAVRTLYGLSIDNANVDKALQRIKNKNIIYITSSQNWLSPITGKIDIFIVGGGGGGGNASSDYYCNGGGGGGGGGICLIENFNVVQNQSIYCGIGAGGSPNNQGGASYFGNFYANGGGAGASPADNYTGGSGGNGGAGGGGGGGMSNTSIVSPASNGGNGNQFAESGYNGIEGMGSTHAKSGIGGNTGVPISYIKPLTVCPFNGQTYAGSGGGGAGGQAGSFNGTSIGGAGGPNGGKGGDGNGTNGASGTPNTGGGGGGGGAAKIGGTGGNGGSGIIIISY